MAFDTYEISNYAGRPSVFYEFRWGNSEWFYTSAPEDITVDGQLYTAAPISDDGVTSGGTEAGEFVISCAPSLPVVGLFRASPPSENVRVVAFRKHLDDLDIAIQFAGKITNVKRKSDALAEVVCQAGKLRRGGLRLTWSRTCPHVLYDSACALNKEAFAVTATVATVTGNGFTLTSAPNGTVGYFNGGIIAWDADGLGTIEQRAIERGTSTTAFVMFGRTDGLEPGMTVKLYPGCDRLDSTCNAKFNNLVNYGGITQMPGESPYTKNIF